MSDCAECKNETRDVIDGMCPACAEKILSPERRLVVCRMFDALTMRAIESRLSAATQALTDMGCELREGVWMKQCGDCNGVGSYARAAHACGGDNERCHRLCPIEEQIQCELCNCTGWLPITRKSVVEGGAG